MEGVVKYLREHVTRKHPVVNAYIACALGFTMGIGLWIFFSHTHASDFGLFLFCLGIYHMWEWTFVALFHPEILSGDSFLINHSTEWVCAWAIAVSEYFIELFFWPNMKSTPMTMVPGFLMVAFGQTIRTIAMYTAGSNFAHMIEDESRSDHKLVTSGIYSFSRHPSYFGWFIWTIGMAVLLANPISAVLFTGAAWYFFYDRIIYEEETLCEMFGKDYEEYRKRVPTRIPFIK